MLYPSRRAGSTLLVCYFLSLTANAIRAQEPMAPRETEIGFEIA